MAKINAATIYSTSVILELGGILILITGIKATKAIIKLAIDIMRLAKLDYWKNMPKFKSANSHNGKKMLAIEVKGNLYIGILKEAYL